MRSPRGSAHAQIVEARDLLLGAAAPPRVRASIRATILASPRVTAIERLLTMQLGTGSLLITGMVALDEDLTGNEVAKVLDEMKQRVRDEIPEAKNVYLVPTVR